MSIIAGTPYGESIAVAVSATGTWDFSAQPGTIVEVSVMPNGTPSAQTYLYRMTVDGSNPSAAISAGIANGLTVGGAIDTNRQVFQFKDAVSTIKIVNNGNATATFCVNVCKDDARG